MADKSTILQDPKTGENIYPVTITDNIYLPNGTPLMKYLNTIPLPLGTLIHSTKIIKSAGLHLADGGELMIGGVYDDFCQYIINNQNEFPNILYDDGEDVPAEERKTALEKWQEEFTTYGQCGKYVITDSYVKLPAITKLTGGLVNTEMSKIASMNEAGLPEIAGGFTIKNTDVPNNAMYNESGAFSASSGSAGRVLYDRSSTQAVRNVKFNASRSNSIYGKSATVETEYVKFPYYIVVATVTKTDIEVNIDNVVTELNEINSTLTKITDSPVLLFSSTGATSGSVPLSQSIRNFKTLVFEMDTTNDYLVQNTYVVTPTLTNFTYFGVYGYSTSYINMQFVSDTQMTIVGVSGYRLRNIYGVN